MDNQTNQPKFGDQGFFFPRAEPIKPVTKEDLSGLKFRGTRTDLQVYHLAYGTKKLRACTYRRMLKRQNKINAKKAKLLIVKSPQQNIIKSQKQAWMNNIEQIIQKNKLKAPPMVVQRIRKRKGNRKRNLKKMRKIKQKIAAAKQTEMKD